MERNVYISIRGIHSMGLSTEEDDIELVTPGKYYERNGKRYLTYEDEREDGKQGRATVKIEDNWKIHVDYTLDVGGQNTGRHAVHILVQDRKGESNIRLVR